MPVISIGYTKTAPHMEELWGGVAGALGLRSGEGGVCYLSTAWRAGLALR